MPHSFRLAAAGAGLVLLAATSACGGSSSSNNAGGSAGGSGNGAPYVIGASVSQTGKFASSGQNVLNGYQLAIDQINKSGGVLGHRLDLKVQDDQSDAGAVGRIYTQYLGTDKVDALLSPYGSPLAGPAAQLADRYKTPMSHSQSSSPDVFKGTKYNVMAGLGPSYSVLAGVPAFAKANGYTKIMTVNNDLATYAQEATGVAAAAKDAGATVVASESYAATTSDFSSLALKISQAAPDVLVMCSAVQDSIGITRAIAQQGFRPKMLVSPTAVDQAFAQGVGPLADKVIGYSAWSASSDAPGSADFATAYQAKYNSPANTQSAGGYAAVQVLAAAIKAAGSTDREKVNKALHSGQFPTILGTYKVDQDGVQTGYPALLLQNQGGQFQLVWPKSSKSVAAQLPY